MKRRIISLFLAATLLAGSLLASAPAYADTKLPFTDVAGDAWYYDAVCDVYDSGLMKGKTDTTFDPTAPMSRAEFVTVLSRIAAINVSGYGYSDKLSFEDTDSSAWYADAAGWAVETGLTKGTSDSTFSPSREITRQEMAVLIVRFVKYLGESVPDNSKVEKFTDADKIASWATADIETMRKYGLIQGDQSGNFNPEGKADRASVATIAMRLLPYVTSKSIVENGKSEYVIICDGGTRDAAERLQYQIAHTSGAMLDITDSAKGEKKIVLKTEDDEKLGSDGYEISTNGDTVTVTGNTADGVYRGAVRFILRATFDDDVKFTSAARERYEFTYPIKALTINGNDISKYRILCPKDASANTMIGVNDLAKYIEKACGAKLPIEVGSAGEFVIIVEEKTVKVDGAANENKDNFTVKTEGNNIRIIGDASRGAMYGCYDFLEDVVGWLFISSTEEYLSPRESLDIKDVDYTESSLLDNRYTDWYYYSCQQDMRNKHKITSKYSGIVAISPHSFDQLDNDYETGNMNSSQYEDQPCLTSDYIFEVMLRNVMKQLDQVPDAKIISISQNDNWNSCTCENCKASDEKYGSRAGTNLAFVNRIADEVKKKYPDVMVHTFAYQQTEEAPTGIKARDNVYVEICTIQECFSHPLSDSSSVQKNFNEWAEVCDVFSVWDYTANYSAGVTPFPNIRYEVLAGNLQLFIENNVKAVFEEGSMSDFEKYGEFETLRGYLVAKLMWDPYMSEEEYDGHIRKFMEGYYGRGWENVYNAMNLWLENDTRCVFTFGYDTFRAMSLRNVVDELIADFDKAECLAESRRLWINNDMSQSQFEFMKLDYVFPSLYKSKDPAEVQLSQEMSRYMQNKILKYRFPLYPIEHGIYPNMTEFTTNPQNWRFQEAPLVQQNFNDVTVEYSSATYE